MQQVVERSGQPVDADHDQGVAGLEGVQEARELGAVAVAARGPLLDDPSAAGRAQRVELGRQVLVAGGDAGIADRLALRASPAR